MDPVKILCSGITPPGLQELIEWYYRDPEETEISEPWKFGELFTKTDEFRKKLGREADSDKWSPLIDPFAPVKNISGIKFVTPMGLILANIDAVFNITRSLASYLEPVDLTMLRYACILEENNGGGEVQYLQYRRPNSIGWGLTGDKGTWSKSAINLERFNIKFGKSLDNKAKYKELIDDVLHRSPEGLDFVFVDTQDRIFGLGIAIEVLAVTGNLVARVDLEHPEYIYLASKNFERVTLFKPVLSGNLGDAYLICEKRIEHIDNGFNELILKPETPVKISKNFKIWFDEFAEGFLSEQLEVWKTLEQALNGGVLEVPLYDLHQSIIVMKIPMFGDAGV